MAGTRGLPLELLGEHWPALFDIPDVLDVDILTEDASEQIHGTNSSAQNSQYTCLQDDHEAFYMVDLNNITMKYVKWKTQFPNITPFYAVKCNDDPVIVKHLANHGTSFDCASKAEIMAVLKLGVSPDRIIFANTFKSVADIKCAAANGVEMMTFDTENELHKIKMYYPDAKLVLRLLPPAAKSVVADLGSKYGCDLSSVKPLLELCLELKMSVIGISFHVGCLCFDLEAWSRAVILSKQAFGIAVRLGINFTVLDIGGGFPGLQDDMEYFNKVSHSFPAESGVKVIAEPGTFFVAGCSTLFANIIGKKNKHARENEKSYKSFEYVINAEIFSALIGHRIYDMEHTPLIIQKSKYLERHYPSIVWGPTCDPYDVITKSPVMLPELDNGDWLMFRDLGYYDTVCATRFNSMPLPRKFYFKRKSPNPDENA